MATTWKSGTSEATSQWYMSDVKRTTLMEQVADDYEQLGKPGRFSKKLIPRGYIPDLD